MRLVQIQEFSLSTAVEYRRAVTVGEARLEEVAKALVTPPSGDFLNPVEISLVKHNELFSYTFSVPLFNGAASIAINAQGITVSFKQGRTKEHWNLMTKLTLAALETAKAAEVKVSILSFTAHATFESQSDYAAHMQRFTALAPSVDSGGFIVVNQLPEFDGEIRYASEKSLLYKNALFIAANGRCQRDVSADLFKSMEEKFEFTAALEGVSFKKG